MSEMIKADLEEEVKLLFARVATEGVAVDSLDGWRDMDIEALLVSTQSGAKFIIEPRPDLPSLVTRTSEKGPLLDYCGPRVPVKIVRYEGNPDSSLRVGEFMDIWGLSRTSPEFDPDSIYTTTPITAIKYLTPETQG